LLVDTARLPPDLAGPVERRQGSGKRPV